MERKMFVVVFSVRQGDSRTAGGRPSSRLTPPADASMRGLARASAQEGAQRGGGQGGTGGH